MQNIVNNESKTTKMFKVSDTQLFVWIQSYFICKALCAPQQTKNMLYRIKIPTQLILKTNSIKKMQ